MTDLNNLSNLNSRAERESSPKAAELKDALVNIVVGQDDNILYLPRHANHDLMFESNLDIQIGGN